MVFNPLEAANPLEPAGPPDALDVSEASNLLSAVTRGALDAATWLGQEPLMVVDLDTPGDPAGLVVPDLLPAIVIGYSRAGRAAPGLGAGLDVVLHAPVDPGHLKERHWTRCDDLDSEIATLATAARACPVAAVTLAQVLRVGTGVSVRAGLAIESLAYSTLQGGPEFARWLAGRRPRPPKPHHGPTVVVERRGSVLRIVLNRPEVHNAYNAAMRDELCDALAVAGGDPSIEEVHLYGAGRSFCSGGDLAEFGTFSDPATAHLVRTSRSPARLIDQMSARITAHLHGSCVGSGIELPAFAGRVRAAPDSEFRLPEVAMGLIPGAGGTASLAKRIGRHRVAWLGLSGLPIGTDTALRWGLVDELDPAPDA